MTIHEARHERFGRCFEEFRSGDVYRHWPGRTITEAEDHLFCMLTMAASPLHLDAHYAATTMEGGRNIVVGTFVYATLLGMSVPDTSGTRDRGARNGAACATWRRSITATRSTERARVVGTRPSRSRPGTGIVTIETRGHNQEGTLVCEFQRSFLVPLKPTA